MPLHGLSVAVIGAGVGGLCAAIALAQQGAQVAVFERRRKPTHLGAGLVLWPNAAHILDRLGVLAAVSQKAGRLSRMERWTAHGEPLGFVDLQVLNEQLGFQSRPVFRADLQAALLSALADLGVAVQYGHNLAKVASGPSGAALVFEGGKTIVADVIVGADGRMKSVCRHFVTGDSTPIYQGYLNWVGRLQLDLDVPADAVRDYWGVGERFGLVPVGSGAAYWAGCKALPADFQPEQGDRDYLLDVFSDWPDPIVQVIRETPAQHLKRIAVYDHDPVQGWHRGNVVLLGDSAHAALPTSGQGACQAMEDAWHLADCLATHSGDLPGAFVAYEARRSDKTAAIIQAGRGLARSLFDEDEVRCAARNQAARDANGQATGRGMAGFWGQGLP